MDRYENAQYVVLLGRAVKHAMQVRHGLLREFSQLGQHPTSALQRAGRIGARCAPAFDEARRTAAALPTPIGAQPVRDALLGWLDAHIQACDALALAGGTREGQHLVRAAAFLRDA